MKQYDVTLITAHAYEQPSNPDWYVQQVLDEDGLVQTALEALGHRVNRVAWSSNFDWSSTRFALFRTPWDYSEQFGAFSQWLERARTQVHFINPVTSIYWNSDKHYLVDLAEAGIAVPTTHYVKRGSTATLVELHEALGWTDTVLKPTISAAGRHTYRLTPDNRAAHEDIFKTLLIDEDLMVQPFLKHIVNKGELALMVVGGQVTHAVRKIAKAGDFRVQDDFGGRVEAHIPTEEEIALAQRAVAVCPGAPLYARVDLVWDNEGGLVVSELEIFEPEMWFRFYPPAATLLAEVISEYMN